MFKQEHNFFANFVYEEWPVSRIVFYVREMYVVTMTMCCDLQGHFGAVDHENFLSVFTRPFPSLSKKMMLGADIENTRPQRSDKTRGYQLKTPPT